MHLRTRDLLTIRSISESTRECDFIASTDAVDSYEESIDQSTWQLNRFLANPVILFGHKSRELPIGRATRCEVVKNQLEVRIKFASAEANPVAEQVFRLAKEGVLRAVSVGFIPHSTRMEKRNGRDVLVLSDNELHEVSVVCVPANAEALAKMKAAGVGAEAMSVIEREVEALVGVKISPDEKAAFLEMALLHKPTFDKYVGQLPWRYRGHKGSSGAGTGGGTGQLPNGPKLESQQERNRAEALEIARRLLGATSDDDAHTLQIGEERTPAVDAGEDLVTQARRRARGRDALTEAEAALASQVWIDQAEKDRESKRQAALGVRTGAGDQGEDLVTQARRRGKGALDAGQDLVTEANRLGRGGGRAGEDLVTEARRLGRAGMIGFTLAKPPSPFDDFVDINATEEG